MHLPVFTLPCQLLTQSSTCSPCCFPAMAENPLLQPLHQGNAMLFVVVLLFCLPACCPLGLCARVHVGSLLFSCSSSSLTVFCFPWPSVACACLYVAFTSYPCFFFSSDSDLSPAAACAATAIWGVLCKRWAYAPVVGSTPVLNIGNF